MIHALFSSYLITTFLLSFNFTIIFLQKRNALEHTYNFLYIAELNILNFISENETG